MRLKRLTHRLLAGLLCILSLAGVILVRPGRALALESAVGVIMGDNVNVREKPNTESKAVIRLMKGTNVTVLDRTGRWYYISSGGKKGYVRDDMIIVKSLTQKLNQSGKINADNVNLRAEPNTSGEIIAKLKKGTSLKMTEKVDNWYQVQADGKTGFIREDYVGSVTVGNYTALREGSTGGEVTEMQNALIKAGFYSGKADGSFGAETGKAVVEFQTKNKLTADGVAGDATLKKLYGVQETASAATTKPRESVAAANVVKLPAVAPNNGIIELRDWFGDVEKIMKGGMVFEVIDVRTSIRFKVRSLYGSYHADVETLTQQDTSLLLAAYSGEWSWDRRPVWVIIDGKYLAGSMNGFPHGQDSIRDNGMPGQICIHFRGSKVHRTGRVCPLHQNAILDAYEQGGNIVTADMIPQVVAHPEDELDDDAHE